MIGRCQLIYIVASVLFIFALHWMNAPDTARRLRRRGNDRSCDPRDPPSRPSSMYGSCCRFSPASPSACLSRAADGGAATDSAVTLRRHRRRVVGTRMLPAGGAGSEWLTPFQMVALMSIISGT